MQEEAEELLFTMEGGSLYLTLDEELYPRDAIYGACYLFIDRCYVFLGRPADRKVRVRLTSRSGDGDLDALAGEFANELLNQAMRVKIGDATASIREYYMARAFFTTPAQASIDQLLAELDAEEMMEDDLEIAVPWQNSGDESGA